MWLIVVREPVRISCCLGLGQQNTSDRLPLISIDKSVCKICHIEYFKMCHQRVQRKTDKVAKENSHT